MEFVLFSVSTIIIPIGIGLWKKIILKSPLKYLVCLVILSLIADMINLYIAFVMTGEGRNNLFIGYIYGILESTLILFFFRNVIEHHLLRKVITILFGTYICFTILNLTFGEKIMEEHPNQRYIGCILHISFAFVYFYDLFLRLDIEQPESNFGFIVSANILLFNAGTIFLYITNDLMNPQEQNYYYLIHTTLHIFLNLGYALAFWKGSQQLRLKIEDN